ncbi:MAG TPA: hypothetical protein PL133_09425 [Methylophilaceae bacterium]|nr:hypothetical protein [Methylophilaceae bacterium]
MTLINTTPIKVLIGAFALFPHLSHAEGTFSLTTGIDYSSGKYGQSDSTDITYIPFTGKYEADNTTLKLTVPWLKIRGPGDVVGGNTPIVLGKSNRPITTETGLGDIVFAATQTIAQLGETDPLLLDLTGKIKFGTASTSKGLGTGENDYTLALDAYKKVQKDLTLFGGIGYKRLGDPTGINLNNVWFSSAGLSYKINQTTNAGIMGDIRQATMDTSQPLRELTLFASHKFYDHYKVQSYLTHGYSDASTDWGGGIMLGRAF